MTIATLVFHLPDERQEYDMAVRGQDAYSTLHHLGEEIRSHLKYGDPAQDRNKLEEIQREIADATYYVGY